MKIILSSIVVLSLLSCQQRTATPSNVGINNTSLNAMPQPEVQSDYYKTAAKKIGFDVVRDKDSLVLRLWMTSMLKPNHVVELRKFAGQWRGKQFDYYEESDGSFFFKPIKQKDTVLSQSIIDSLHRINFFQLISQEKIQGFDDFMADGQTFHLEIFMPFRYKLLRYNCPESYDSKEPNNKRFVDIVMLLDKHFNFYMPLCKRQ